MCLRIHAAAHDRPGHHGLHLTSVSLYSSTGVRPPRVNHREQFIGPQPDDTSQIQNAQPNCAPRVDSIMCRHAENGLRQRRTHFAHTSNVIRQTACDKIVLIRVASFRVAPGRLKHRQNSSTSVPILWAHGKLSRLRVSQCVVRLWLCKRCASIADEHAEMLRAIA